MSRPSADPGGGDPSSRRGDGGADAGGVPVSDDGGPGGASVPAAPAAGDRFEWIVTTLATRFIACTREQTDPALNHALRLIGEYAAVDRAYIFWVDPEGQTYSNTHEWCAPGVAPQQQRLQRLAPAAFPWFFGRLVRGDEIHVPDVAHLPPEAAAERAEFEAEQIRSLMCIPMGTGGRTVGFVGFDAVRAPKAWQPRERALLRVVAEMFANAIGRRRADEVRERLEGQMRHAQRLESLGVLAGGIAHDFNNLLTTMLGNATLALEALPAGAGAVRHAIQQIEHAARRARDLTRQMLAYAGKGRMATETLDLTALCREMLDLLRVSISKKADLRVELAPGLSPVWGDAAQLQQVVLNLLTNASEAIGDRPGTITLRTHEWSLDALPDPGAWVPEDPVPGRYVALSVGDTGAGMDAATRARIFEPFFSTKFAGRGLGLAAVLGIVGSHRGALRVESAPGVGSTFVMLLPAAAMPLHAPPAPAEAPTEWRGTGTILVVDDEPAVRAVARNILQRAGFRVVEAGDGRRGLAVARAHPELAGIVLDLSMPEMDGIELLRQLRGDGSTLPVLLCSGYAEEESRARAQATGCVGFLQKPYQAGQLRQAVREVLARRPGADA